MASIIDSFKEVASDKWGIGKLLVFAVPLYYCYALYVTQKGPSFDFYQISFYTLFFMFGFLIKITNNVINERNVLLPSLNPLKLAWAALKGIVAIGIPTIVSCVLVNYIISMVMILPWLDIAIRSILWLLAAAVITSSFLMYCQQEKVQDAFKFKFLFDKAGDLIVILFIYVLKFLCINVLTLGFLGYAIYFLFGVGPGFVFYCAFFVAFNVAVTGHYMAQVNYESTKSESD